MMNEHVTDRLTDYLDGELAEPERRSVAAHLATCAECRGVLAELEGVVARAGVLDDPPPAADLWPGIARRIGVEADELARRRQRRRISFTVPQLLAAGVSLAVLAGGSVWLGLQARRGTGPAPIAVVGPAGTPRLVGWVPKADASADVAVAQLRLLLSEGRKSGRLDSTTVAKLEHSLTVIDGAIAEARRALAEDPTSPYLNHHLAETMRHKLQFLRQANALVAARS